MIPHIPAHPARFMRAAERFAPVALAGAFLATVLLAATFGSPDATLGSTTKMVTACADVNVRTKASTSATRKATLAAGVPVTVVGTVSGGSFSTTCAGRKVEGSTWLKISAINGKSVSSRYGVSYVYGAKGLFAAASTTSTATGSTAGIATASAPIATLAVAATAPPALSHGSDFAAAVRVPSTVDAAISPTATAVPSLATKIVTRCDGVNLRTRATTAATRKVTLKAGVTVKVTATVTGGSYRTTCAGSSLSGSTWYRISAINGRSVSSLYGVTYVYGAGKLFKKVTTATTLATACGGVNLRTRASTSATRKATLKADVTVTAVARVSGSAYSTTCAGRNVSGSSWFKLSRVNGKSVSSLYGVSYVYAAAALFRKPVTVAPSPTPSPTPTPTETPTPTATPAPTAAPTAAPTPTSAPTTATPTAAPTAAPTPTPAPTTAPTAAPTPAPTAAPTSTPAPTATLKPIAGIFTLGSSVTFHGRGWGHGVGLSQYGARGRAGAGQDHGAILAHYYKGATLGTMANAQIRVVILDNYAATSTKPLTLYGRGGPWTIDGIAGTFPADARMRVIPTVSGTTTTWKLVINAADGTILHNAATTNRFRIRPASTATRIQVYSKPSSYDRYRGVVRVVAKTTVDVVNELPIETYLRGVVPAEMPSTWHVEALKAQTIAARSYAARRLRPGESYYDLYDDTRSQVYLGSLRETNATDAVITATAGQVLKSGSSIANTVFHSAGGGATEHNENSFVSSSGAKVAGAVSYLRGSSDRRADGTAYDSASPYATWKTATYTRSQLSSWFAGDSRTNVGTVAKLDLRNRGVSGRLISVTLIGSTGTTKTVSGDVFRAVVNANKPASDPSFRSNLFALTQIP